MNNTKKMHFPYLESGSVVNNSFYESVKIGQRIVGFLKYGIFNSTSQNHLGTYIIDENGNVNFSTPFGEREERVSSHKFLDYTLKGHRFYDPKAKRFLTPDTYLMENVEKCVELKTSCNLYGYARNNPLSFTDPTGQYENAEIVSQREDNSEKSHIVFSHGGGQIDKVSMTLSDGNISGRTYNGEDVSMSPKDFLSNYSYMAYSKGEAQAYGNRGKVQTGLFADKSLAGLKQIEKLNDLGNLNDAKDASIHLGADVALPGPAGAAVSVGYSQRQKFNEKFIRLLGPTSFSGKLCNEF